MKSSAAVTSEENLVSPLLRESFYQENVEVGFGREGKSSVSADGASAAPHSAQSPPHVAPPSGNNLFEPLAVATIVGSD